MGWTLNRYPNDPERPVVDRARHRESVLVWMRRRGYRDLDPLTTARDVLMMAHDAGITERDLCGRFEEEAAMSSTAKVEIEWLGVGEDPPPTRNGDRGRYARIADELRKQPGRWAVLSAPRGSVQALRRRGLQTAQRNGNGKEPRVYARWPA